MVKKDFDIDTETLSGLHDVSNSEVEEEPNSEKSEQAPNPKYVMISLFSGSDRNKGALTAEKSVSNPAIYEADALCPKGKSTQDWVDEILIAHIKKYGPITELKICGHGHPNHLSNGDSGNIISTFHFLIKYSHFEQSTHIKNSIHRVIFDGCNTFSNLGGGQIEYYREFAKKYNMEIVGTTSLEFSSSVLYGSLSLHAGRFVQFSPKGDIIRDKLDTPYDPAALLFQDKSWTNYYIGHTQEEGEALKKAAELQQENARKAAEKRQAWENKLADCGPKI
ncbi:MAG: hypothetical protein ACOYLG_01085 [Chitinophagaceae bacterium]